jgi:NAD(P)-dependent dehydrogenase (short-subunit alcohol dehydrogenase family)
MNNPMALEGKRVLVTGASSGIGRETAVVLAELGASVALSGRNEDRLNATLSGLRGEGHTVEVFDLNDVDGIPKWIKTIGERGALSGVAHLAGVHQIRPVKAASAADTDSILRANVTSALMIARGFRQKGVCAERGSLVFASSSAGLVGNPGVAGYSASKGALIALTKSLAMELAKEQIRVNCVAPGWVETEMTAKIRAALPEEQYEAILAEYPLGIGQPRDVANGIAFLLSEASRWMTGSTLVMDGGYTAH